MRIVSAGIVQETNTFSKIPTDLDDFVSFSSVDQTFPISHIRKKLYGTSLVHGGFFRAAEDIDVQLAPVFYAEAMPGGTVTSSCYCYLKKILMERITSAMPFDGLLLDLHGAMVAEGVPDVEGDIINGARAIVGDNVPIVATLDFHGNISSAMVESTDALLSFSTYPHVDMSETGYEALTLLYRMIESGERPKRSFVQIPLITLCPAQCTDVSPMSEVMKLVSNIRMSPGVAFATLCMGFPYSDVPDAGAAVVVGEYSEGIAARYSTSLADFIWMKRDYFSLDLKSAEELIDDSMERSNRCILAADCSDNPGAGAPSDGTYVLRQLIERETCRAAFGVMYDPDFVKAAASSGLGSVIEYPLGGKLDERWGPPIVATWQLRKIFDGEFQYKARMKRGLRGDYGPACVVGIGEIDVIVGSRRLQTIEPQMFEIAGIDLTQKQFILVKSSVHFRDGFSSVTTNIHLTADPKIYRKDLSHINYNNLRDNVYPSPRVSKV